MYQTNADCLCHAFPQLYGQRFAFAYPDSWAQLLRRLIADLVAHAQHAGLSLVVTDVKEKRGQLRYYADGTDEEADELIDEAERESTLWPMLEDAVR